MNVGTRLLAASHIHADSGTGKAGGKHLGPPLPAWMASDHRACKDLPTQWWFAPEQDEDGEEVTTTDDAQQAEAICRRCPLQLDCREYGLRHEKYGRWGAVRVDSLLASQRRSLLDDLTRQRARKKATA